MYTISMKTLDVPYKSARYNIDKILKVKLDDSSYNKYKDYKLNVINNQGSNHFYFRFRKNGKYHYLHREIAGCKDNLTDVADHIDGDTLNCTSSNLRVTTRLGNSFNKTKPNNETGFMGVRKTSKNSYSAYTKADGVTYSAYPFRTAAEAHAAYLKLKKYLSPF